MSKRVETNNKYTNEFKLNAVLMYLSGKYGGIGMIYPKLGLRSSKQLRDWIKKYKMHGIDGLENMTGKFKGLNKGKPEKKELTIDEEVLKLKAENDYLKGLLNLSLNNIKKKNNSP